MDLILWFYFSLIRLIIKTMLFIPEAFDPLTDTTNYPLTRILYSLSPKMHAIYLFPKVFCAFNCQKGIFQFKHCYCTRTVFFRDKSDNNRTTMHQQIQQWNILRQKVWYVKTIFYCVRTNSIIKPVKYFLSLFQVPKDYQQ